MNEIGLTTTKLTATEQEMTEGQFTKYISLLKQFSEILGLTISECYFEKGGNETIDWEEVEV